MKVTSSSKVESRKKKIGGGRREYQFINLQFPTKVNPVINKGYRQKIGVLLKKKAAEGDKLDHKYPVVRRMISFDPATKKHLSATDILQLRTSSPGFSVDYFKQKGSVFNKKFWDINLSDMSELGDAQRPIGEKMGTIYEILEKTLM